MIAPGGTATSAGGLKRPALVAVPPGAITPIGPLPAPAGTVATICEDDTAMKLAGLPLNVTSVER